MKKFCIFFLLAIAGSGFASDRIYLRSNKIIKGHILDQGDDYVRIKTDMGVALTYYFEEIEHIASFDDYYDDRYAFRIEIPSGWEKDIGNRPEVLNLSHSMEVDGTKVIGRCQVIVDTLEAEMGLAEYFTYSELLLEDLPYYQEQDWGEDDDGIWLKFKAKFNEIEDKESRILKFFVNKDKGFIVLCKSSLYGFTKYDEIFAEIIHSFQLGSENAFIGNSNTEH